VSRPTAQTQAMRAWILEQLPRLVPGLPGDAVQAALVAAGAWHNRSLRELYSHLRAHRDALTEAQPDPPLALIRLAHVLNDAGYAVLVPACVSCGVVTVDLLLGPHGRVCVRCMPRREPRVCARCGRVGEITTHRAEGGICRRCYSVDPQALRVCGRCGRARLTAGRLDDGTPACYTCWPRPVRTCVHCGRLAPSKGTKDGSSCIACYQQHCQPRRVCGVCGQIGRIARRATDDAPDLCCRCYRRPTVELACSICGRERPCMRMADGSMVCRACNPKPKHVCFRCGRSRVTAARWPAGPICHPCYETARRAPGRCHRCQQERTLTGRDEDGHDICGPCAGAPDDCACSRCGGTERGLYIGGECDRCVLARRLDDLLGDAAGAVGSQLAPLRDALAAADQPRRIIPWLQRSQGARLLVRLASRGDLITHQLLDQLPQGHTERYVRVTLMNAQILPARHEDIERISAWLEQLLADGPDHHARVLRPFTQWVLLRRARRRADLGRATPSTAARLRTHVYVVLEFLTWLDGLDISLAGLRQDHVDAWLISGGSRRYEISPFLAWTAERGLTGAYTVPSRADRAWTAGPALTEDQRWQQLRHLLDHDDLPVDARVAGGLVLLYGLPASRLRVLTVEHIQRDGDDTYLDFGSQPLFIPPRLAVLLNVLAASPRRLSMVPVARDRRWLFPGVVPGEPLSEPGFMQLLRRAGVSTRAARSAALIAFAAELPPSVLAELLGVTIHTAQKWAARSRPDWAAYLKARMADDPRRRT
jgi:hypothetical protein